MQKKVAYHVAIDLRLSGDDEDIEGRSERECDIISSQRELARSFVREQPDMKLFDIYIADGYSGVNLGRPDFKKMMEELEEGNVNCVVVKDLFGFGRDYMEAGRFTRRPSRLFLCVLLRLQTGIVRVPFITARSDEGGDLNGKSI